LAAATRREGVLGVVCANCVVGRSVESDSVPAHSSAELQLSSGGSQLGGFELILTTLFLGISRKILRLVLYCMISVLFEIKLVVSTS